MFGLKTEDRKNRITVYLIKDGVDILTVLGIDPESPADGKYKHVSFGDGVFYYGRAPLRLPSWVGSFFNARLNDEEDLLAKSPRGVYFKTVGIGPEKKTFALPFGYGRTMIDKACCVDDFGLKLALNIIDRNKLRKTKRRSLASEPKNTIEQLSKTGGISDFGFDPDRDLLEEVTATPETRHQADFGKAAVTGKDSFTVNIPLNVDNIQGFLKTCYENYRREDYRDKFPFVEQIKPISDTEGLEKILIGVLNGFPRKGVRLWMAVPEVIDWEEVEGFSFAEKSAPLADDISLDDFKKSLKGKRVPSIKYLKNKKARAFKSSAGGLYDAWSAWQCLCCEIEGEADLTLLTNGRWYRASRNFVATTKEKYDGALQESDVFIETPLLPATGGEREDSYNKRLAESIPNAVLMDRKMIFYGGGSSQIEFCDVYDKDRKAFIHVKKNAGSSVLSHLFAQGEVSGQLFLADREFREKAQKKEPALLIDPDAEPKAEEYAVVFAIISESPGKLDLPFFSKVRFNQAKRNLRAMRFRVYIAKIGQSSDTPETAARKESLAAAFG